ncbi:hypothetical protein [Paracoccus sp. (in: a-proteobacteria)]|uniref:hypothetical protein n=1 Tax=Paracoccus sp. TaxID=267 RepID=UPI00289F9ED8|nr:hypothetical protein [Paracoccus sp. (in: a-proteobacteria)]
MKMHLPPLRLAALAMLLLTVSCVSNQAPQIEAPRNNLGQIERPPASKSETVVIRDNKGGNVMRAIQRRQQLERWGGPVEIRGYCGSACTLFITMPNACLGPNATIGFHAPRIPNTTYIPPGVDEIMARYYRNGILARWNDTWKHQLKIEKISAKEYVRLDPQTRICK